MLAYRNVLTPKEIAPYLIESGLVSARSIVEGDLAVLDASRRNSNFKVVSERGTSYLIKQGVDRERASTIANEASVCSFLQSDAAYAPLRSYLPVLHMYSPEEHVEVFEFVRDAYDLREYHTRLGRFPTNLATDLGLVLGTLHSARSLAGTTGHIERRDAPWPLTLHRPNFALYERMSNANVQLVSTVQSFPAFGMLLDALRARWPEFAGGEAGALVHYDIKLDNVLVVRDGSGRTKDIKLVDWELAGLGDPAWDVGALLGEYLGFWLLSIPITGESPPERFLDMALYPLSRIQPALGAFWRSYKEQTGLDGQEAAPFLWRAVAYAACRLLQTAFESSQGSSRLTGNALCLLQLSFNVLQRPFEAAAQLLGITEP
ncbi:MAG: phosphotransferase [Chloroflexota bacterium]